MQKIDLTPLKICYYIVVIHSLYSLCKSFQMLFSRVERFVFIQFIKETVARKYFLRMRRKKIRNNSIKIHVRLKLIVQRKFVEDNLIAETSLFNDYIRCKNCYG